MSSKGITKPDAPPRPLGPDEESRTVAGDSKTVADSGSRPSLLQQARPAITVPDHELLACIGRGSYGEVWLARNVMGTFRAVKIVFRSAFDHARPFEREFNGIQKFEPISRSHDGFVDVLQIGRTPEYFYYVMELADDVVTGQQIDPATYEPKTLRSQVQARRWRGGPSPWHGVPPSGDLLDIEGRRSDGRLKAELHAAELHALPFQDCVELGLSLTAALSHLHGHGLIHRDIKPSNIIFVNGIAKLADIGLVAEQSEAKSFVGTEGFIPPEGPGTPQADIYSLGKVLYEMATGKDRHEFPALPTLLGDSATETHLLELNSVFLKACQSDLNQRYRTATQMREDLLLLRSGRSVKRAQEIERRLAWLSRASALAIALTLLAVLGFYLAKGQAKRESALRARAEAGEYGADMALAYQAFEIGHLGRARELLAKHQRYAFSKESPASDSTACWEWRYLWKQVQGDDLFILGRHEPLAQEAMFCPDGQHAYSSGRDGQVIYWDVAHTNHVEKKRLPDRTTIALSADGARLAAGLGNGQLIVWKTPGFQTQWQLTNQDSSAARLLFSRDGQMLAVAGGEFVTIYSTEGQVLDRQRTGLARGYSYKLGLAFSPDSQWLAYGRRPHDSGRGETALVNSQTKETQMLGETGDSYPYAMAFSPDGKTLAIGSETLQIWDFEKRQLVKRITEHRSQIASLAYSPDGRLLATASADQTIKLWDTGTWEPMATLTGHEFELWSVAFSPDGTRLISAAKDDTVRIWPVKKRNSDPEIPMHDAEAATATAMAGPRPMLTIFRRGQSDFEVLDPFTGKELLRRPRPAGLVVADRSLALLPDLLLATGTDTGKLELWNLVSGKKLWSAGHTSNSITALDASESRREIAVLYADGTTELLAASDGTIHRSFYSTYAARSGMELFPTHLAYSLTGNRLLASADRVTRVPVWDLEMGVEHQVKVAHREGITFATLSRDGRLLCTSSYDAYAIVSDVDSGDEVTRCSGQFLGFRVGTFSPDGTRLALIGENGYLSIWSLQGQRLGMFHSHPGSIYDLSWDHTGNALCTAGDDGVRIWRAPTFAEIRALTQKKNTGEAQAAADQIQAGLAGH